MSIPNFTVRQGRLLADGTPVAYRASPNVGDGLVKPRFLVMHSTSGSYAGAVEWLCDPAARASAHMVISETGAITQLVPLDRRAWHAGAAMWRGVTAMNANSIGIELANYGDMIEGERGAYRVGKARIPDDRVMVARHRDGGPARPWHTYTEIQIETARAVAKALHAAYGFEDVCGHEDIAPGRKVDPGPAFPMAAFRASVLATGSGSTIEPARDEKAAALAAPARDRSPSALQRALNVLEVADPPLVVDGDIGPATRAAIRLFQQGNAIPDDGVAGPVTWAEIEAALKETSR